MNRRNAIRCSLLLSAFVGIAGIILLYAQGRTRSSQQVSPSIRLGFANLGPVRAIAFSPDGTRLAAAGGEPSKISIWRLPLPTSPLPIQEGNDDYQKIIDDSKRCLIANKDFDCLSLQYSPDGKLLIGGNGTVFRNGITIDAKKYFGSTGSILVFDANTLERLRSIRLHWSVYGLAVSPDGKTIAAIGSGDDKIYVGMWDTADLTEHFLQTFPGHSFVEEVAFGSPLRQLVFSHDGTKLLAATLVDSGETHFVQSVPKALPVSEPLLVDGIQVIDVEQRSVQCAWKLPDNYLSWIDLSPDDCYLAAGMRWNIDDDWAGLHPSSKFVGPGFQFLNDADHGICIMQSSHALGKAYVQGDRAILGNMA